MDRQLAAEILTGSSKAIIELKADAAVLEKFVEVASRIDRLPNIGKRFYEESRSLYQATATRESISAVESILLDFFGAPAKPAGEDLPRKFRKNPTVNYLGGLQKEQTLFLLPLKHGEFYGALWPWRRKSEKIEIHLGYCSERMSDEEYHQLETLVKRCLSHSTFEQVNAGVGGMIHGISIPSFLQMAEMEQSTFCLQVTAGARNGKLHVGEGALLDAETENLAGREAAYRIISWDNASIGILPAEENRSDNIQQPLMHVLMESLKIKDETTNPEEGPPILHAPKARPSRGAKPARPLVRLERAPVPRMPRRKTGIAAALIILAAAAAVAAGGWLGWLYMESGKGRDAYEQIAPQLERAGTPEARIRILTEFLQAHENSAHAAEVRTEIASLRGKIEESDFEKTTLRISRLPVDEKYEKTAIGLYGEFLEKYPQSSFRERINKDIASIKNLLDQYYFEELKRAARLDFGARLKIYENYVARNPDGRFNQDVQVLIHDMGRSYFDFLKSEAVECEQKKNWDPCLRHTNDFISNFPDSELGSKARQLQQQMADEQDLFELRRSAEEIGADYRKVMEIYQAYLEQHPESTRKKEAAGDMAVVRKKLDLQERWLAVRAFAADDRNGIIERIQRVDAYLKGNLSGPYSGEAQELRQQLEVHKLENLQQQRLSAQLEQERTRRQREMEKAAQLRKRAQAMQQQLEIRLRDSERFKPGGDGTVVDLTTGLTWCLLDSYQELDGCLDYAGAKQYVRSLKHGGRADWRLPTAGELAAIYKKEPFFPQSGAEWYWTSEAYIKGYHSVAEIVSAKPETVFSRENRDQNQCGAVRAVRP